MDIFRRRRRNPWIVPAIVLAVAGSGGGIWYFASSLKADDRAAAALARNSEATPTTPTTAPKVAGGEPAAPAATAETHVTNAAAEPVVAPSSTTTRPTAGRVSSVSSTAPSAATTRSTTTAASQPTFNPGTVMHDAQKLVEAGDLLGARNLLNAAIVSGRLPADQQRPAMQQQAQINQTLIFSPRRNPADPFIEAYNVAPGDVLQKIAPRYSITAKFVQRVNKIADARRLRAGQTIKLIKGPFHAIVTKSTFTMDLYLGAPGGEGSLYVCSFPVGLGQDDSTPTGRWQVEVGKKLEHPKYYDPRGGGKVIEPEDPANPLGEYWLGLAGVEGEAVGKLSYGIHGTIEPDSIGKMSSMGCIRMRNDDIAMVYDMLVEGKSTVIVNP